MSNTSIEERIIRILLQHPEGISAKDIAKQLDVTKRDINPILYNAENEKYEKLPYSFDWVLKDSFKKQIEVSNPAAPLPTNTAISEPKESFNQTRALLNTFFNGNKALIELFERMCVVAFKHGDPEEYRLRANSTNLIGVAKHNQRFYFYVKKSSNSFRAIFCDGPETISFKTEKAASLLSSAEAAFRTSDRALFRTGTDISESEYSLTYLSGKPQIRTPHNNPAGTKKSSIKLDYNTTIYVKSGELDHSSEVRVSVYVIRKYEKSTYVAFYANKGYSGNTYIISRDTYKKLKKVGIICAQIYDYSQRNERNLNDESIIAACGYTTSVERDLNSLERQCILDKVIENGLWTPSHIASHLQYCIISHPSEMYALNRHKWEIDRQYIINKYIRTR